MRSQYTQIHEVCLLRLRIGTEKATEDTQCCASKIVYDNLPEVVFQVVREREEMCAFIMSYFMFQIQHFLLCLSTFSFVADNL